MSVQEIIGLIVLVVIVVCFVYQYKAMNRTAFGRSLFISVAFLVMGLLVGMLPTIPATIVSVILLLFGFGMIVWLGFKSYQHLHFAKRQQSER